MDDFYRTFSYSRKENAAALCPEFNFTQNISNTWQKNSRIPAGVSQMFNINTKIKRQNPTYIFKLDLLDTDKLI